MKFKTYKAARNYLINRLEKVGVDVRDVYLDSLMSELFTGRGVGDDFELTLSPRSDTFSAIAGALRVPRRGSVSDAQWMATMRRLGAYMGIYYVAGDADAMAVELKDQALFSRYVLEEAL